MLRVCCHHIVEFVANCHFCNNGVYALGRCTAQRQQCHTCHIAAKQQAASSKQQASSKQAEGSGQYLTEGLEMLLPNPTISCSRAPRISTQASAQRNRAPLAVQHPSAQCARATDCTHLLFGHRDNSAVFGKTQLEPVTLVVPVDCQI